MDYRQVIITGLVLAVIVAAVNCDEEETACRFIDEISSELQQRQTRLAEIEWCWVTNITDENERKKLEEESSFHQFNKQLWLNVTSFNHKEFKNETLRRIFHKQSVAGSSALGKEKNMRHNNVSAEMKKLYSTTKVCVGGKCDLELEPDLVKIMAESRNCTELEEAWTCWHNSAGKAIRPLFFEYVALSNEAAVMNGFKTLEDIWMFNWECNDFKDQIDKIWQELEPFYKKFHAFVRMKLKQHYPMPEDGTIPAHLLGNMWAQSWNNILSLVTPFPSKNQLDVTKEMVKQNYTVKKVFEMSDKFYQDLGMIAMPEEFWSKSMLEKPADRKVLCHASAWDFMNGKDFRIKQCTTITMNQLVTVHHEMGHIQYYLQYKDQPIFFRKGANPGFHEAVGDLIALSVATPKHLNKIGLLEGSVDDHETTINHLMQMALTKCAFMPWGYVMDLWRWDIFRGDANKTNLNRRWWELRLKYQGVSPPCKRSEKHCDGCAKYHTPAGVEYIRYFVAHILQFSFHKALCQIAQPDVPLHQCDIDNCKEAGQKFAQMLRLGLSRPWQEQLEMITGSREMSAKAMIEYFEPLCKYIDEQIKDEKIGWTVDVDKYYDASEEPIGSEHSQEKEMNTGDAKELKELEKNLTQKQESMSVGLEEMEKLFDSKIKEI